ncbi:unnamed protein product [Miscanthus lutarioriparius]|uniref:FLZ-type domain-containing protein n=1 Tax=Miscanthus lutarioriparius TaxID=422564 RepID=A0A811SMA2_9POAL|nr:unnamed protein product [Miscanthus lutarioriparius]
MASAFFFDAEPVCELPSLPPTLDACALCAKPLGRDCDIFMYRGTRPSAARTAAASRCSSTPSAAGGPPHGGSSSSTPPERSPGTGSPGRCLWRHERPEPA